MRRTFDTVEISVAAWDEIAAKLQAEGHDEAIVFTDSGVLLDTGGIALVKQKSELMAGLE